MGSDSQIKMFPTTTWSAGAGCHGGCGQKLFVKDGMLVRVEGDESAPWNQGRACPRVLALKQYAYHPDRITTPLKRVGPRGEGKFEPISWDEAFDTCEEKLKAIREDYGAESVIFVQGTGRDAGGPLSFLAYNYGSPNWCQLGLSGQSCYTPRLGGMKATFGDFCVLDASQFSPERYNDPEWKVPEVILVWGQNPPPTCPDGFFGHWVVDCMQRGSQIISVDPRYTWMSTRAKHHLQIRPGTDAAMALGMLNVIINEGLYDKEFVENWCYGFDELKERVQQYPLSKVSEITWVPGEQIAEAARLFAASKPASVQWGVPVDMNPNGTTTAQAIAHLWAITGNVDNPGGMVIAKPSHGVTTYPFSSEELESLYGGDFVKMLNEKRIGCDKYPMVKGFRGWAQPDMAIEQIDTGKPYPVKAAWIQTANPLGGQAARTRYHYDAMKKLDFVVVVDLFHNPTSMALADIILPAATFAEKDSFRSWWVPLGVMHKVIQVGECKSDWEINFEMAKRLNPKGLRYNNIKELMNNRLEVANTTFDELVEKGSWDMPPKNHPSRPYARHERSLLRADGKQGFNTETGKVELYSKAFEGWGLDPLPFFEEPLQSPVRAPELYEKYPLIMIAGSRSPVFFHAEHRMIPWLREKNPEPYVEVHPQTARDYDVYNGEWIYLENDMGRIKRKVRVSLRVHPKMVGTQHGWWMPEMKGSEPDLFGVWDYQVNKIVPGPQHSDSGFGGGQYKTTLVKLSKITE